VATGVFFHYRRMSVMRKQQKDDDLEGNKWTKSLKGVKGIKASYSNTFCLFVCLYYFIASQLRSCVLSGKMH